MLSRRDWSRVGVINADVYSSLQQAVNDAATYGARVLITRPFSLTSRLTLPSNSIVEFTGSGMFTTAPTFSGSYLVSNSNTVAGNSNITLINPVLDDTLAKVTFGLAFFGGSVSPVSGLNIFGGELKNSSKTGLGVNGVDDLTIRGLTVHNAVRRGMLLQRLHRLTLDAVHVYSCGNAVQDGDGIRIDNVDGLYASNLHVHDNGSPTFSSNNGTGLGLMVTSASATPVFANDHIQVIGGKFYNNGRDGLSLFAFKRATVVGVTSYGNGDHGIAFQACFGVVAENSVCTGCYAHDNRDTGIAFAADGSPAGSGAEVMRNAISQGNHSHNNGVSSFSGLASHVAGTVAGFRTVVAFHDGSVTNMLYDGNIVSGSNHVRGIWVAANRGGANGTISNLLMVNNLITDQSGDRTLTEGTVTLYS